MKLRKGWIFGQLFFLVATIISAVIFIALLYYSAESVDEVAFKTIIMCFSGLFFICFSFLGIHDFLFGCKYIEVEEIPMKEFKINIYDNSMIMVYKNYAWAIPNHHKKSILAKKFIKAKQYYNRKKKESGWSIDLPYLRKVA